MGMEDLRIKGAGFVGDRLSGLLLLILLVF